MDEAEDIQLKAELDEIAQRIDSTMRKIETVFEPSTEIAQETND
jgi:hypothetical protein